MTILFIENKKIFTKWASKTYEYKYNSLVHSDLFTVIDMDDDLENINPNEYSWIIFGWHGIHINKFYNPPKHNFYKKKIPNLETADIIKQKIKQLHNHPNKAIVVQDMHSQDYYGGLDNFCIYINEHNIKKIITPYLNIEHVEFIKRKCNIIR